MNEAITGIRLADALHIARSQGASDIHVSVGMAPAVRIDGRLEFLGGAPLTADDVRALVGTFFDADASARVENGGDVSSTWVSEESGTIRLHAFRTREGLSLAMRLLNKTIPSLDSLHLPPVVATFAERQRGLVLFTGPTGSGKSTSLAGLVDLINSTSPRRVITIEDPIEYRHTSKLAMISQREIGRDAPSFAHALVGALRADPDVIMLGEMRDSETIRAALTAAETGHLVLATLHTGDAPQTIDRIVDAFTGSEQAQVRAQLAQVLVAIVCQRLVPRAAGSGRRVAAEVLIANDAVRNIVRESRSHQLRNVMLTGRQHGMQTLEHHLGELIAQREIDRQAALALTDRVDEIRLPAGTIA